MKEPLRDRAHRCAAVLARWAERGLDPEIVPALCGEMHCVARLIAGEKYAGDELYLAAGPLKKALSR
jgi:hypothetical protein